MDYLLPEQIQFKKVYPTGDSDFLRISFISNRLKALMLKKIAVGKWRVMQLRVSQSAIYCPGYDCVFTAPTKKSVLFARNNI